MGTLIDRIEANMLDDDSDRAHQSELLQELYERASPADRLLLDNALICICGYSLQTLLSGDA